MKRTFFPRIMAFILVLATVLSLAGCGIITIKPAKPGGLQPTRTPAPTSKPTPTPPPRYIVYFDSAETFETETERRRAQHVDTHIEIAVKVMNTIPEEELVYKVKSLDHSTLPKERDKITNPTELYIYDLICESAKNFTNFEINNTILGLERQAYNNAFFSAADKYHIDHPELHLYADTYSEYGTDKIGFYFPGKWLDTMTDDIDSIKFELDLYYWIIDRIMEKMPANLTNLEKCVYFSLVISSLVDYDHSLSTMECTYESFNALTDGLAVCGGYALALYELCKHANIHCQYVTGFSPDQNPAIPEETHAWNRIETDQGPIYMDVTWYDPDDEMNHYKDGAWVYLLMTEERFEKSGYILHEEYVI